ncbi:hypothetical protein RJT34_04946 [Clitoria ternatea]|uniref:Uncharacterized protein n=1 Tax=Clitoria ternatea TaxID=43366 RepID=A0AAN9Q0Z3_CLITE
MCITMAKERKRGYHVNEPVRGLTTEKYEPSTRKGAIHRRPLHETPQRNHLLSLLRFQQRPWLLPEARVHGHITLVDRHLETHEQRPHRIARLEGSSYPSQCRRVEHHFVLVVRGTESLEPVHKRRFVQEFGDDWRSKDEAFVQTKSYTSNERDLRKVIWVRQN